MSILSHEEWRTRTKETKQESIHSLFRKILRSVRACASREDSAGVRSKNMAQGSELHWSRWRYEESTRTYEGHILRLESGIKPHVPQSSRKQPSYRTRYIKHRNASREITRRDEQRRIDLENYALGKKIAHAEPAIDTRPREQIIKIKPRLPDPIKDNHLAVSNVALLRRLVAAKPFVTREELDHECQRMQVYLERLRRVREERLYIIQRRMDLCKEIRHQHADRVRHQQALKAQRALENAKQIGQELTNALVFRPSRRPRATQLKPRARFQPVLRNLEKYKEDAKQRGARRAWEREHNKRTRTPNHLQIELHLLRKEFDRSLKPKTSSRATKKKRKGKVASKNKTLVAEHLERTNSPSDVQVVAHSFINGVLNYAKELVITARLPTKTPEETTAAVAPAEDEVLLIKGPLSDRDRSLSPHRPPVLHHLRSPRRTITTRVMEQKAKVLSQIRATHSRQVGLASYLQ